MNGLVHILVNGLFLGISYAVLSSGMAITMNVVGIINLSHGAFYLLGCYLAYSAAGLGKLYPLIYGASFLGPALVGYFIARVLVNPLRKDHFSIAVGTLSIAIFFEQAAELIWGERAISVPAGRLLFEFLGERFFRWHAEELILFALTGVLLAVLPRTKLGLAMRITAEDEEMAKSVGIDTDSARALAFSISSGLASLAGTVTAPGLVISPTAGRLPLILSLIAVILSGHEKLLPVFAVSILLGMASFSIAALSHPYVEYIALLGLILVIITVKRGAIFSTELERDY